MRSLRRLLLAIPLVVLGPAILLTQSAFNVDAYRQFLDSHRDINAQQLLDLHPAGIFRRTVADTPTSAAYFGQIESFVGMTPGERALLSQHGFLVSQRLSRMSFGSAFAEIFYQDLPVFVSSDAILHAVHMSYDVLLRHIERARLVGQLDTLLARLHAQVPILAARYADRPDMRTSLADVDLYLTIARSLLTSSVSPIFPENLDDVVIIENLIAAKRPADVPLFSTVLRTVDFSQFTVRGHYTQDSVLSRYFQAMIWLGRTEMYLSSPVVDGVPAMPDSCIRRQMVDACLLVEALEGSGSLDRLQEIDESIRILVGESDNVTVENLREIWRAVNLPQASDLLDSVQARQFRETLLSHSFSQQRINSQIIMSDPTNPEQVELPAVFLLLGQRFVVDSYIMGSVVYDRIVSQGEKVRRMLPSPLDVMYALGNDAAAQLLEPELERFPYGSNLAALRYLVDGYDDAYWSSTFANAWLRSIRSLNAPADRSAFPAFMRTAAWWQEKLNTQVASWAQLRHDNLLYTKQSYSVGVVCSYPEGYVEPIPAFYRSVRALAETGENACARIGISEGVSYFQYLGSVAGTLESIATKELEGTALSAEERAFLQGLLRPPGGMCGDPFEGWYAKLFFGRKDGMFEQDYVVADVHTAPTDEAGIPVGWVLHVGTGPVELAVVTATLPEAGLCAFVGPVMSSYEYLSTGFRRLTDEEWKDSFAHAPSKRFAFTDLYLADSAGAMKTGGLHLVTGVGDDQPAMVTPGTLTLSDNFPNPFNPTTMLDFSVPVTGQASLAVYDVLGRRVAVLFESVAPAGRAVRVAFDAQNHAGGVYFARLVWNGQQQIRKMILAK